MVSRVSGAVAAEQMAEKQCGPFTSPDYGCSGMKTAGFSLWRKSRNAESAKKSDQNDQAFFNALFCASKYKQY